MCTPFPLPAPQLLLGSPGSADPACHSGGSSTCLALAAVSQAARSPPDLGPATLLKAADLRGKCGRPAVSPGPFADVEKHVVPLWPLELGRSLSRMLTRSLEPQLLNRLPLLQGAQNGQPSQQPPQVGVHRCARDNTGASRPACGHPDREWRQDPLQTQSQGPFGSWGRASWKRGPESSRQSPEKCV